MLFCFSVNYLYPRRMPSWIFCRNRPSDCYWNKIVNFQHLLINQWWATLLLNHLKHHIKQRKITMESSYIWIIRNTSPNLYCFRHEMGIYNTYDLDLHVSLYLCSQEIWNLSFFFSPQKCYTKTFWYTSRLNTQQRM